MLLLTPGPLTTHADTRAAMAHDWGSRDRAFVELSASVCRDLAGLVPSGAGDDVVCVPMQGSGTFAVEAAVGTLVPRTGRLLVLHNGSYGARIVEICRRIGRDHIAIATDELAPLSPATLDAMLAGDRAITHVAIVHVETGAGLENPLADLVAVCHARGRAVIVDAMSSFGALPLVAADAIVAASGKCLEGPPGMGFVIARRAALVAAEGNAHSLALDLADQHAALAATGQWRFTPPTQVVAALRVALDRLAAEGGPAARLARYRGNCDRLVAGMRELGFPPLLAPHLQAPIIVSFRGALSFERMRERGFVIYPGKLAGIATFRIGCIGALPDDAITKALAAVRDAIYNWGVAKQPGVKLSKDDRETIRDRVRNQVRAGYDNLGDLRKIVGELEPDELFADETIGADQLRTIAREILDTEVAALARDAKKWPKKTDNDRLDAAFEALEDDHAVLARQDYWCCQTCGSAAIADEMKATKKGKKPGALGYVFFHNQDTESAVFGAGLYLAYGSADAVDERTRVVGRAVVGVLQEHGFTPEWDGDIATRILLPIDWRRRLPKRSVARP